MAHFFTRISFISGLVLGIILAVYLQRYRISENSGSRRFMQSYANWSKKLGLRRKQLIWDELRYSNKSFHSEADYLFDRIKVLCIIIVNVQKNIRALNETWARGCNGIMTIFPEPRRKIFPVKQSKGKSSWTLLCNKLHHISVADFEWILIVKDTSFVIMENLRYYVAPLSPKEKHYLGHAVKFWNIVYNSASPGYVLSRKSVEIFQNSIQKDNCDKFSYYNREDFYLGKYLAQMNITPTNTIDDFGLSTFHPYNWYHVFYPGENYYKDSFFTVNCCSPRSIAFQATEGDKMYTFNYLFYKLQIFIGGKYGNIPFVDSNPDTKPWKEFLRNQSIHNDNISSAEYYELWENLINNPLSFANNLRKEQLFDYN